MPACLVLQNASRAIAAPERLNFPFLLKVVELKMNLVHLHRIMLQHDVASAQVSWEQPVNPCINPAGPHFELEDPPHVSPKPCKVRKQVRNHLLILANTGREIGVRRVLQYGAISA